MVSSAGPVASCKSLAEALENAQKDLKEWAATRVEAMLVSALGKPLVSQRDLIRQHWLEVSLGKYGLSEDMLQPALVATCKGKL